MPWHSCDVTIKVYWTLKLMHLMKTIHVCPLHHPAGILCGLYRCWAVNQIRLTTKWPPLGEIHTIQGQGHGCGHRSRSACMIAKGHIKGPTNWSKKIAQNSNFGIQKNNQHTENFLKLVDKICKNEMDPASIVEDTEWTQFCPQIVGKTGRQVSYPLSSSLKWRV